MPMRRLGASIVSSLLLSIAFHSTAMAVIVGFEELNTYTATGNSGSYYNGNTGNGVTNAIGWSSHGARFSNSYTNLGAFDFWDGFSYSNVADATTAGFTNQYAAFPGSGSNSSQYAVAFVSTPADTRIEFPFPVSVQSLDVANTTYAGLSMANGDAFSKKFGGTNGDDPDFFRLSIEGFLGGASKGIVDVFLADFRFADSASDFILRTWQTQALTGFGNIDRLQFGLTSSDVGTFGMNTPAYFALDNLRFTAVPEPTSGALIVLAIAVSSRRRRARANR